MDNIDSVISFVVFARQICLLSISISLTVHGGILDDIYIATSSAIPLALPGCSIASRRRLRMSALHMMRMNGYSGVATVTFSMLIDGLALAVAVL
jgi:hypothetical protein